MLYDIPLNTLNYGSAHFLSENGDLNIPKRLYKGMYQINHFNFNHMLPVHLDTEEEWPEFGQKFHERCRNTRDGGFNCYGVCDSPEQFRELVGDLLESDPRKLVVSFTFIDKADEGGWRWHKWGPYIGKGHPTSEYLHDEELFDEGVWVYSIYDVSGIKN